MFRDRYELVRHSRRHTGDFPFRCNDCNKGFMRHERYMTHLRWHSGNILNTIQWCLLPPKSFFAQATQNGLKCGKKRKAKNEPKYDFNSSPAPCLTAVSHNETLLRSLINPYPKVLLGIGCPLLYRKSATDWAKMCREYLFFWSGDGFRHSKF